MIFSATLTLTSCMISKDPSKVRDKLKDEKYEVLLLDSLSDMSEHDIDDACEYFDIDIDCVDTIIIAATKKDGEKPIIIFFCDNKKGAKRVKKDIEAVLDDKELVDEIKEALEDNGIKSLSNCELKRSGSVVAFGHEDTMKIIK